MVAFQIYIILPLIVLRMVYFIKKAIPHSDFRQFSLKSRETSSLCKAITPHPPLFDWQTRIAVSLWNIGPFYWSLGEQLVSFGFLCYNLTRNCTQIANLLRFSRKKYQNVLEVRKDMWKTRMNPFFGVCCGLCVGILGSVVTIRYWVSLVGILLFCNVG